MLLLLQVYIYAGKGALERSSEAKLKLVIDRMRPVLRQGDYNAALEQGIVDLGLVLAGGEPKAEPEDSYWGLGIFLSIFAGIIGLVSWCEYGPYKKGSLLKWMSFEMSKLRSPPVRFQAGFKGQDR